MTIALVEDMVALQEVGQLVGRAIQEMRRKLKPGMTKAELDDIGEQFLKKHGAQSAPRLVYDFPGTTCISVNDETVHGVPNGRRICPGDLVTIDVTAELNGYMADSAITVPVPPVSKIGHRLCRCAISALQKAVFVATAGRPINHIGWAVQSEVNRHGFNVIPELSGHGLGKTIHEEPTIPNFYHRDFGQPLTEGLVIAIEPIISAGSKEVYTASDGWTVKTKDGGLSAHYEHTIIITKERPIILTQLNKN